MVNNNGIGMGFEELPEDRFRLAVVAEEIVHRALPHADAAIHGIQLRSVLEGMESAVVVVFDVGPIELCPTVRIR